MFRASPKKDVGSSAAMYSSQHVVKRGAGGGGSSSPASAFQDFQQSTDDAWDAGDDEFIIITDVAKSTALSVLSDHSQAVRHSKCRCDVSEEGKAEAMQRLASQREGISPHHHRPGPHPHPPYPGVALRQIATTNHRTQPNPLRDSSKLDKFHTVLNASNTDLKELRQLSWSGIPIHVRGMAWRLLCGYLPPNNERREPTLSRKREEYFKYVAQYYNTRHDDMHQDTYRQIHIDIPRMSPLVPLFQQGIVQEIFERILFIWAIRHPASGYVQGMNDLVTPFFIVFLQEVIEDTENFENLDVSIISDSTLRQIEADSFWCMGKLLDGIQDNYTFAQPGIQTKVNQLKELIQRINSPLHNHLTRHNIEYLQFSFRWMNNLLMRELPLRCTIRLWDTYLSESDGFATFHLYVCAAFLIYWSDDLLKERDFQGLMLHLQNLPTQKWTDEHIALLVADAFRLKYMFADAPNHLQQT